ncbi:MAG: sodium:proton antiporter [Lactobacillaceae bacterium]|nr:sodium:proton antiporter [Lactobacillaceae bacterium]
MDLLLGIILLLTTVVVANVIHLIYPKIPLSIYQIIAGVLLASLPTTATNFTMHPEIFMMVVIAPLMFNDGQNQSFRYLSRNFRSILSIAVVLSIVTVIIAGAILHLTMPQTFSFALAFMLAAIITPTDAVAVKSITTSMSVPENVDGALEYESLFNDASGIVLLDLALAAYRSGDFSVGHGLWIFIYVFFGGIIFGAILGILLINLRTQLMRSHVDIGSIVIPINVMTPIVVYWLAEELHFSGILAVVAAGVVHSILYDRLRLTSTKVQMATTTTWTIISDALNGLVFVLLGVLLPQVLRRTSLANLGRLFVISLVLYLIMTFLRYCWVRFKLVNIGSTSDQLNRDSILMALGGIHGTITLSLAFSLPVIINHHTFAFRNSMILIAAIVILISLLVGAIAYPLILPAKSQSFTSTEFRQQLIATVQFAINQLRTQAENSRERAIVIDQLSTQMNQYHQFNQQRFNKLMNRAHKVEMQTLDQLNADGTITDREATLYVHFISRSICRTPEHSFAEFTRLIWHRIKWQLFRKRHLRPHRDTAANNAKNDQGKSVQVIKQQRKAILKILTIVNENVDKYLQSVENTTNANEAVMVGRVFFRQKQLFSRGQDLDADLITNLSIEAFQWEHSFVQERLAAGKLSQDLANALNEQISTDELVYSQSLD